MFATIQEAPPPRFCVDALIYSCTPLLFLIEYDGEKSKSLLTLHNVSVSSSVHTCCAMSRDYFFDVM